MKIAIATPCFDGNLRKEFCASLVSTIGKRGSNVIGVGFYGSDACHSARNRACRDFLNSDYDKLFFIDADISWTPEQFYKIALSELDILAGYYPKKGFPIRFPLNGDVDREVWLDWVQTNKRTDGMVAIDRIPAGFMCLSRKALKDIQPFCEEYDEGRLTMETFNSFFNFPIIGRTSFSEDYAFCLAAKKAWVPVLVDPSVCVNHYGVHCFSADI